MKETLAKLLSNYAHQRGGAPVVLTDPATAEEVAALVLDALPKPEPEPEPAKTEPAKTEPEPEPAKVAPPAKSSPAKG